MKISRSINRILHKLDLLLQKNSIEPDIEFYDDGVTYYVFIENAPEYFNFRDSRGRYIYHCGSYGDCVHFVRTNHITEHEMKICSASDFDKI